MRYITPIGEYTMTRREVRFRCEPPLPLPGKVVMVVHREDVAGSVVRVNDIGGDEWITGRLIARARGRGLTRWTEVLGSA